MSKKKTRQIVVDGYNYIMASYELRPVCLENKEDARALCAELLSDYSRITGAKITIVYDNRSSHPGSRKQVGRIEEVYCRPDEIADDVIKNMVQRKGKKLTIVSSDNEVAGFARHFDAEVIGSGTFDQEVENCLENENK